MDYSKLSDFEINKLVALKLGYRVKEDFQWEKDQCWVKVDKEKEHSKIFDYCGDANDAWPIILENGICLKSPIKDSRNKFWSSSWNEDGGSWSAGDISHGDKNPLRAAMIVFLMMKD